MLPIYCPTVHFWARKYFIVICIVVANTIIAEAYLEPSQTSMVEIIWENT